MATAKTVTYAELRASLSRKNYAPAYLIHGEEGFFIDRLVEEFEAIVPDSFRQMSEMFKRSIKKLR